MQINEIKRCSFVALTKFRIDPLFKKALFLFAALLSFSSLKAQESTPSQPLSVYLDCRGCNSTFIRSEIEFINFVRDQADAEVHLIITRQGTGSGGTQYTLNFIGQGNLENRSTEYIYNSYDSDTDEEERNGLVTYIKLGFVSFLTELDALDGFNLSYSGRNESIFDLQENDPWNSWIFEFGGSSWFSGEETRSSLNLNGRARIRRITETWKFNLNYNYRYNQDTFQNDSLSIDPITFDTTEVIYDDIFKREEQNIFSQLAYSINDHWSVGGYVNASSSSRNNIDLQLGFTPAIEYSFYPYREYARREVTLRYGIFTSLYDYTERTIFGETSEVLARQELVFNMDYTKPWGSIEARINGRHYLHDFSKNRLNLNFEIDMRIVRGLSVFFETGYAIINDQLSLSAGGVTDKEAIANTRQQATSYEFWGAVGFEVTFGSIYNNIVNTRL